MSMNLAFYLLIILYLFSRAMSAINLILRSNTTRSFSAVTLSSRSLLIYLHMRLMTRCMSKEVDKMIFRKAEKKAFNELVL